MITHVIMSSSHSFIHRSQIKYPETFVDISIIIYKEPQPIHEIL